MTLPALFTVVAAAVLDAPAAPAAVLPVVQTTETTGFPLPDCAMVVCVAFPKGPFVEVSVEFLTLKPEAFEEDAEIERDAEDEVESDAEEDVESDAEIEEEIAEVVLELVPKLLLVGACVVLAAATLATLLLLVFEVPGPSEKLDSTTAMIDDMAEPVGESESVVVGVEVPSFPGAKSGARIVKLYVPQAVPIFPPPKTVWLRNAHASSKLP